jgi:hypothetical protein
MTVLNEILTWIQNHEAIIPWLAVFSVLTFIGSLVVIPILVIHIPQKYFLHQKRNPAVDPDRNPGLRFVILILKNVFGVLFVLAGIAMLVLPGQGLLTILIGVILVDFPGKYALERKIIRQKQVLSVVNRLRARAGRQPIQIPTVGRPSDR